MGLFDFLKKKTSNDEFFENELFSSIGKYNEYIVRFIGMQQQGNYAPISACEKANGEIAGFLYVTGNDDSYTLSAEEVVEKMEERFEQKLAGNEIKSYAILYHSQFDNDDNHKLASTDDELKAITVSYNFSGGKKGKIGLPYRFENGSVMYQGFSSFSQSENNLIFSTSLEDGKDYFQDREEIKAPVIENEIGLKVKKSNTRDLSNTWCGIFGFESYGKPNGNQALKEHFALALSQKPIVAENGVSVFRVDFGDVAFKAVAIDGNPKTVLPIVNTNYVVDVENKDIDEWENADNIEAIVSGRGRDTFGLWYLATDYAENRKRYLTEKNLNIKISGIAFVLDIFRGNKEDRELNFSEDFTAYMPNNDLPNQACFDFIGHLEDFRETTLLNDGSLHGYILNVRLITNAEVRDFFTIDIYVAQENMRFKSLTKGMKLTGVFQMQGQIAD